MQNTRMKKHWTSFMALALLSLFAFVSCGKSDPRTTLERRNRKKRKPPRNRKAIPIRKGA